MASGNSSAAYAIKSAVVNEEEFQLMDKEFDLMSTLEDIENGGNIQKLLMFLSVEDKEKNNVDLHDTFGKNWQDKFNRRWVDSQDDSEGCYKWFITIEATQKLTGKQCSFLAKHITMSVGQDSPDCWGDMLVAIILVVAVTYGTAGAGGPSATALVMMWFSIAMTVTRTQMDGRAQLIMAAIMLASGNGFGANSATAIAVGNLAIQGMSIYEDMQVENAMKELDDKYKELEELNDAAAFDRRIKYIYHDSYHSSQREGHEKDPLYSIRDQYQQFSIYDQGGGSHWIQQD